MEVHVVATTETAVELRIPALQALYDKVGWLSWPAVRFVAGAFLVPHGAQKLFGLWGGNIANTGAGFAKMGLEPGLPLAYLVGSWEFFGGILIAIGFLTRPAALGAAFLLAVAAFMVHLQFGFFWTARGVEYPLMWTILMLAIAARGAGALSVDSALRREF
jgi:putative oxidoreductase